MKLLKKISVSEHGLQTILRFSTTTIQDKPKESSASGTTIDREEVNYFSNLSKHWWNTNGGLRALHKMNELRVPFVKDCLVNSGFKVTNPDRPLEGVKLLDVGCGGGILSESLAKLGAEVTGLDASKELITIAREHAALNSDINSNLKYIESTIEDLSMEKKNQYDAVVASEIIEHVNDQELFLKSCIEVLKPNGSIFVSTFNKTFLSWFGGIIIPEHVLKFTPLGTHDWNKFISPEETENLLRKYNCETTSVRGMFYNPRMYRWLWINSTNINYILHAVKRNSDILISPKYREYSRR